MISFLNYKIKASYIATILIFISLGINPSYLDDKILNYEVFINTARFFSPTIFLIGYFCFIKKYNFFDFLNTNIHIKFLFLILIIILIFSLFNEIFSSQNLYFISYINIFLFISLLSQNSEKNEIKNNIIIFITLGLIISIFLILFEILTNAINLSELYKARILSFDVRFLNQAMPRSTGLSKFLLFILLILLTLPSKKNIFFRLTFIALFSSLLILLNSRTSIIFFVIIVIYLIFCFSEEFKSKIQLFIVTLVIPFVIFIGVPNKFYNVQEQEIEKKIYKTENKRKKIDNVISLFFKADEEPKVTKVITGPLLAHKPLDELTNIDKISSGRMFLWKKIYNDIIDKNINIFVGKGILGDKKIYQQSSSNGFIYSILSGGIFTLIFFLILNISIFYNVMKNLFEIRKINHEIFINFIILYLLFRLLFENGYLLYVSDLYLFLTSLLYKSFKILKI